MDVVSDLTARERTALMALYSVWYGGEAWCLSFRAIEMRTEIPKRFVRGTVRRLAQRGLAEYRRGLFDCDGMAAGSGYCLTDKGAVAAQIIEPAEAA